MTASLSPGQRLTADAMAALRSGNVTAAHGLLKRAIEHGETSPTAYFAMAQACHRIGDAAGELDALFRVLLTEPRNLPALLMMAEAKTRASDDRAAVAYYRTALSTASTPGLTLSEGIIAALRRGEQFLGEANRRFAEHLELIVTDRGSTKSVRHAIDLLLGKTELYLQQPTMFYFPGLPQRAFFERDEFAWVAALEGALPQIRDELAAIVTDAAAFTPYVTKAPDRPMPDNPLLDDPSWGACHLFERGVPVAGLMDRCPATFAALRHAPLPHVAGRSPMALFSLLRPGTHIQPHHGLLNTRLICHLPLIVPTGCRLRVGNETRVVREGETLIFDDSFEHEAWNDGSSARVVLLFEIWRPELSIDERTQLTRIYEAIDQYDPDGADSA